MMFWFRLCSFTDDMKSLLVLSQPPSYSLVNFMDFTVKQKGDSRDGKQVH